MVDIKITTLIDITKTGVIRPNQGSQLELDQNRNFITLLQCAEMRSVISYNKSPTVDEIDITDLGFGTAYKGHHKIWTFWFTPDREFVYSDSKNNEIGLLIDDLDRVPVIKNLTETINIEQAMFDSKNIATRNTIIMAQQGTN
jgi:hypothetical protein